MSKHLLSVAILILSMSLIYCGLELNKDKEISDASKVFTELDVDKGLWTLNETAQYLSITEDQLHSIVSSHDIERGKMTSYETYQFIPYIEMNEEKYFNKTQVDEWIKYNSLIWTEIP